MPKNKRVFNFLTLSTSFFISTFPAFAGTISLQTTLSVDVQGQKVVVTNEGTNRGDESAFHVQASVELLGQKMDSKEVPEVRPGQSFKLVMQPGKLSFGPGRYPVLCRVTYTDANQYPFTSISATSLAPIADAMPQLMAVLEPTKMAQQGRMTLKLKNLDATPKSVTVQLFLARELTAEQDSWTVALGAQEEKTVTLGIKNFSALAGSTYPVFAVTTYTQDEKHYTLLPQNILSIQKLKLSDQYQTPFIVVFIVLIGLLIYWNVKPARR